MSGRIEKAKEACEEALRGVDAALPTAPPRPPEGQQGIAPLFDRQRLQEIRQELMLMLGTLDPERFTPAFGWYLVDQHEPGNLLQESLSGAVARYKAIRPKDTRR